MQCEYMSHVSCMCDEGERGRALRDPVGCAVIGCTVSFESVWWGGTLSSALHTRTHARLAYATLTCACMPLKRPSEQIKCRMTTSAKRASIAVQNPPEAKDKSWSSRAEPIILPAIIN